MAHLTLQKSGFRLISSCRCRDVLARCGADDRKRYPRLNSDQLVLRHPFHIVGGCTYRHKKDLNGISQWVLARKHSLFNFELVKIVYVQNNFLL